MLFKEVLGQERIKKYLTSQADAGNVPHAQLFIAPEGSGALSLALAYAQYVLCQNAGGENTNGNGACNTRCHQLAHPDLHMVFPVAAAGGVKSRPVSADFLDSWRLFVQEQPYGGLFDWYQKLGIENQQGQIGVDEAQEITRTLSLKAYEGGYKVVIIWMAEKMNAAAANKLLKLLEEPPHKTLFLLLAEEEEQLMDTIRSRCQVLHLPPLTEEVIHAELGARGFSQEIANRIAPRAQGNFNKALQLAQNQSEENAFEERFSRWVQSALKARGNKGAIQELIAWSEQLAGTGRENQKQFLHYGVEIFRQAWLLHYNITPLVHTEFQDSRFRLSQLAPFVNGNSIAAIFREMQEAIFHIERNGNAKLILTDLSIKLTRHLHNT